MRLAILVFMGLVLLGCQQEKPDYRNHGLVEVNSALKALQAIATGDTVRAASIVRKAPMNKDIQRHMVDLLSKGDVEKPKEWLNNIIDLWIIVHCGDPNPDLYPTGATPEQLAFLSDLARYRAKYPYSHGDTVVSDQIKRVLQAAETMKEGRRDF